MNEVGGAEYIAATVALNLAVEFWTPLRSFIVEIMDKIRNRPEAMENSITLSLIDSPRRTELVEDVRKGVASINHCARCQLKFIDWFSRSTTIIAATAGVFLLYFGSYTWWNIFLFAPLLGFAFWTSGLYFTLRLKGFFLHRRLKGKITHLVLGKNNINNDELKLPDLEVSEPSLTKQNEDTELKQS